MPLLLRLGMHAYNATWKLLRPTYKPEPASVELKEIADRTAVYKKDICDHLSTIFAEATALQPHLMVELGVRDGSSRFSLERAAKISDSYLVSIDVCDYREFCNLSDRWHFVQQDDIEFAAAFPIWCRNLGIEPVIDILFVDTSHHYDHTSREIEAWFPFLAQRCKVMFHDTNSKRIYRRSDGTAGGAWNNHRGVIGPIEDYLGAKFNERIDFVIAVNGWIVRHWAHCNGLIVMERYR